MPALKVESYRSASNSHPTCVSFLLLLLTDHHKLSSTKQQKFIIFQFCRSEVQHGSQWAKIRHGMALSLSGGLRGRCVSVSFPTSRGHPHTQEGVWPFPPFSKLAMSHASSYSSLVTCPSDSFSASLFKDDVSPTETIQNNLPILRSSD